MNCVHCGGLFEPKFPNAKLCYECFKKRERAFREYDDLLDELSALRDLVHRFQVGHLELPDPDVLRFMIQKTHPDRHDQSPVATRAVVWLNRLREKADNA
jgi:hypothetical protein